MGFGASSPGLKRSGREADHSPQSTTDDYEWSYTSTPQYIIMVFLSTLQTNGVTVQQTGPRNIAFTVFSNDYSLS
jgi:hypothetical protein